jgi:hypothetical protein
MGLILDSGPAPTTQHPLGGLTQTGLTVDSVSYALPSLNYSKPCRWTQGVINTYQMILSCVLSIGNNPEINKFCPQWGGDCVNCHSGVTSFHGITLVGSWLEDGDQKPLEGQMQVDGD